MGFNWFRCWIDSRWLIGSHALTCTTSTPHRTACSEGKTRWKPRTHEHLQPTSGSALSAIQKAEKQLTRKIHSGPEGGRLEASPATGSSPAGSPETPPTRGAPPQRREHGAEPGGVEARQREPAPAWRARVGAAFQTRPAPAPGPPGPSSSAAAFPARRGAMWRWRYVSGRQLDGFRHYKVTARSPAGFRAGWAPAPAGVPGLRHGLGRRGTEPRCLHKAPGRWAGVAKRQVLVETW